MEIVACPSIQSCPAPFAAARIPRARRAWQTTRAGSEAARRRLESALAELELAAEQEELAELRALKAMGIGSSPKRPATVPKAQHLRDRRNPDKGLPPVVEKPKRSVLRKGSPPKAANIVDAWKGAVNTRDAWRQKTTAANNAFAAQQEASANAEILTTKPRRGGGAQTAH